MSFGSTAATIRGGLYAGILIGYALKKVIKMVAIIVGLFLAGLAYLQ
ncbi:MAG TPA: FUN14 domain-containing protein [Nitrososphaeraceae archaeon]|nr:FUN14 domain-containing protein [Nitrososphaeraceae archaeon]